MPQATDIRNVIADRLWVLFEAQATITDAVTVGARNKENPEGWLREKINRMPAAQRRLSISFAGGNNSLFTGRTGFTVEDKEYDPEEGDDFPITRTHRVVITYSEPLPKDPGKREIQEAIEQTIFRAGPSLGLPDLIPGNGLSELANEDRPTRTDEYPNPGRVSTFRLTITTIQSALSLSQETP